MALFILYLLVVTLIQDQAQCLHVSLPYGTGFQENERIFHLLRYVLANSKPVFLSVNHSSNGQNTKEATLEVEEKGYFENHHNDQPQVVRLKEAIHKALRTRIDAKKRSIIRMS